MSEINLVKVFSATKHLDRNNLGECVTEWIRKQPEGTQILDKKTLQSSDNEFHCISIILFCNIPN